MVSIAHGTMHALATIAGAAVGILEQNLSQRVHDGKHVKDDADQLRVRLQRATALPVDGAARLLDVRDQGSFVFEHLRHAVNIPLAELRDRSGELPASGSGSITVLCGSEEDVPRVHTLLTPEHGGGWSIDDLLVASADLWDCARGDDLIETGPARGRFMWKPSPHLPLIVAELERFTAPSARRCVDLGCGKGRDAIWLASRGWHVTGVDNQQCFLRALELFAARQGLSHLISCVQLDVVKQRQQKRVVQEAGDIGAGEESMERLLRKLFAPPLALVNVARFMHRGLLDDCVCFMPRGCVLGVHHFLEGAVSLKSGREIKAHDANMCSLARGELSARYADSLPHVLLCDEETLEGRAGVQPQHHHLDQAAVGAGHGPRAATRGVAARPMCSFAARKPPLLSIAFCSGGGEVRVRARLHV